MYSHNLPVRKNETQFVLIAKYFSHFALGRDVLRHAKPVIKKWYQLSILWHELFHVATNDIVLESSAILQNRTWDTLKLVEYSRLKKQWFLGMRVFHKSLFRWKNSGRENTCRIIWQIVVCQLLFSSQPRDRTKVILAALFAWSCFFILTINKEQQGWVMKLEMSVIIQIDSSCLLVNTTITFFVLVRLVASQRHKHPFHHTGIKTSTLLISNDCHVYVHTRSQVVDISCLMGKSSTP